MKKIITFLLLALSLTAILCSCGEDGAFSGSKCDHKLTVVPYKQPTCQESGNRVHYECEKCGKTFADKEGKKPVSKDKLYTGTVDHSNLDNGFACVYCGIPMANAYSDEIAFFNVNNNTPEQITGGMSMLMGKGVKLIHIYGVLTPEQVQAVADGLSGDSGDLVINFHNVETIGGEFNGKEALAGYIILNEDTIAAFNENGLKYWSTVHKKYDLVLTDDITMTAPTDGGSNWTPIHLETHIYGNGYKITGLRVVNPEYDSNAGYAAGFCYSMKQDYSTITDLHFVDAYVKATVENGSAGIISASTSKGAVISGCSVSGEVIGVYWVGGISGAGGGDIIGCVNYATVTATENAVGGIVGQSWGNVIGCVNYGTVKCTNTEYGGAGGILGGATNGSVVGCLNLGSVFANNNGAGGFATMIPDFVEASANYWRKNGGDAVSGISDSLSKQTAIQIKGSVTLDTAVETINLALEGKGVQYRLAMENSSVYPATIKAN